MAAFTTRLRAAPAAMFAGLVSVSLAFEEVAATSRLSWKAAEVVTVLATDTLVRVPVRMLFRARVDCTAAVATS